MPNRVEVVPYDPAWKHKFKFEAEQITRALRGIRILTHHIGSTAIPKICANPIVDILLEVDDIVLLDDRVSDMAKIGYEA